jgi:hypothetical protein
MQKVLLAVGNEKLSQILRNTLSEFPNDFNISETEVFHHRFLEEIVESEIPDILILHDFYLESDCKTKGEKEKEWISFIKKIRVTYDDSIRIVFLCERPKGDPFLSHLVSLNVLDIFSDDTINKTQLVEQLKDKPRFSRVQKYLQNNLSVDHLLSDEETTEEAKVKEKQVIIEVRKEIVEVEKEVERISYASIPSKLIAVCSLWQGAGSTFFAANLARAIANRGIDVSYIEFPLLKPYMFGYLGIHTKETEKDENYIEFTKIIRDKKFKNIANKRYAWNEYGIDWYVVDPRKPPLEDFSYEDMLKLSYAINSAIKIVDVSSMVFHPEVQKFLHHVAEIFVCIEPDPIKLDWLSPIKNSIYQRTEKKVLDFLENIEKTEGIDYQLVTMKHSHGIKNKEWINCFDKKPLIYFPSIDYDIVIKNIWNTTFIYDDEEFQETLEKVLKPAIVRILPQEFCELNNKDFKRGFSKIFSIFKG